MDSDSDNSIERKNVWMSAFRGSGVSGVDSRNCKSKQIERGKLGSPMKMNRSIFKKHRG